MPSQLAALLTIGFIAWLLKRDYKEHSNVSKAVWLPIIWLCINCSRYVSQWLGLLGISLGGTVEEGSPVDALFYLALIGFATHVLYKRQVNLTAFARQNVVISLFLAYCFISLLWSDYPFIGFKRWVKTLGHPLMALIILTDPNPLKAFERVMKQCAYVLIPLSILFIKYYPDIGRGFDGWTGAAFNTGVGVNKNQLGIICLIFGYFFIWQFLQLRKLKANPVQRNEMLLTVAFIVMICWLQKMARSSTPLVSLLVGVFVVLMLGLKFDKTKLGTYFFVAVIFSVLAEAVFGVTDQILLILGKDRTLTDRTLLWDYLLKLDNNVILGTGFETFWLGERRLMLEEKFPWRPNQAHNGYLETYLHLGTVGLTLVLVTLTSTFLKARTNIINSVLFGRYRLGFLIAVIFYNWTEASFKAMHPVWTVFYMVALDYRCAIASHTHSQYSVEPYNVKQAILPTAIL